MCTWTCWARLGLLRRYKHMAKEHRRERAIKELARRRQKQHQDAIEAFLSKRVAEIETRILTHDPYPGR